MFGLWYHGVFIYGIDNIYTYIVYVFVVDSRDRKDSLSGSLRQLTPPSSQENLGHSSQTLLNSTVFSQTLINGKMIDDRSGTIS